MAAGVMGSEQRQACAAILGFGALADAARLAVDNCVAMQLCEGPPRIPVTCDPDVASATAWSFSVVAYDPTDSKEQVGGRAVVRMQARRGPVVVLLPTEKPYIGPPPAWPEPA